MGFRIGKYDLYFYTVRTRTIRAVAQLMLYDIRNVYRGDLVFHREVDLNRENPPESSYDPGTNTFRLVMHESALGGVLVALRQRNPSFLRGYDQESTTLSTTETLYVRQSPWPAWVGNIFGGTKHQ